MSFDPRDVVLLVLIVHACWTDLRTQKIKNYMTFPVMVAGIVLSGVFGGAWWVGIAGWVIAVAMTVPAFAFGRALNAGDVKMLAAAGALLGPEAAARACLFTFMLGLPAGLIVLAVKGRLGNLGRFAQGDRSSPTVVAHAPVVALGILLARLQPWPNLWGSP